MAEAAINIIQAMLDANLLKPLFRDMETWRSWIVFLKALFALPMDPEELALYQQCTGRERPPDEPFREAWVPTGRRSGKSFIAALIAVFLACFRDYREYLAAGERAYVLVIASDRGQAQVILRYVKGFLKAVPMLAAMIENDKTESIDLNNSVSVMILTCSYKAVRGFTAAAIICDEIAFWRDDSGRNPGTEVLRALRPSLGTIPGAILVAISSPYSRSGPLWEVFNRHHGQEDSDILTWQAATTVMNPTFNRKLIERDLALDPEAARAEWLAEFRSDLEDYLPEEAIRAVTIQGRFELPPVSGTTYTAFVDPSGGRKDAAGLAIAHISKGHVILDLARRFPSPHDPGQVVKDMAEIVKSYRLQRVIGDKYAGAWPEQEFLKHSITYVGAEKDKSSIYLDFLPLVLSGSVELLDNKHLFAELRSLERRTRKGGKDLVDHAPKASDDLANAVAGACVQLGVLNRESGIFTYMKSEYEARIRQLEKEGVDVSEYKLREEEVRKKLDRFRKEIAERRM